MAPIRYLVSILVSLILTIVGGFLTFSGGFSIVTMLTLQFAVDREIGDTGVSMNDLMAGGHSGRIDVFADPSAWFMTVSLFLVGLALLFFGIRGLYLRISAGLPEEDEGDAETALGRLGSGLVFGIGTAYGCYAMVMLLIGAADYLALRTSGVHTIATIEKEWLARDTETKDDHGQFVSYSFQNLQGEGVVAEKSVQIFFLGEVEPGSQIEIIYDPKEPSETLILSQESWFGFLTRLGGYGFLIVFGIRGLYRNFRLQELDEEAYA